MGYTVHGVAKSRTQLKQLSTHDRVSQPLIINLFLERDLCPTGSVSPENQNTPTACWVTQGHSLSEAVRERTFLSLSIHSVIRQDHKRLSLRFPPFPTAQHLLREHFRTVTPLSSVIKTEGVMIVLPRNIAGTHEKAHTLCVPSML